jgi:hypothetical protein
MVSAGGKVSNVYNVFGITGLANPVTSVGGPWTTGKITVSQTQALAGAEIFVLSGDDQRVSGVGSISLVGGGLSKRAISGPHGNRGWMNLIIGSALPSLPVPITSVPGVVALIGLMSLAGGYAVRRRNRK